MSGPEEGPVAILTALPEELRPILRRATEVRATAGGWQRGRLGGASAVFGTSGDGSRSGFARASALCEAFHPRILVGAGVAGALSRDLAAQDLVVARRIRDSQGEAPAPDPRMRDRAVCGGAARLGTLVTVDRPVTGRVEKESLATTLGVTGPAAVDMESAAWARAADAGRVPFLVVRAVSDTVDEELPSYLSRCVGEDGRIHRRAVVLAAFAHPSSISNLTRMRRRMKACGERLGSFLEELLADGL